MPATPRLHNLPVKDNRVVCRDHGLLTLAAHRFGDAHPGQFVHLGPSQPSDPTTTYNDTIAPVACGQSFGLPFLRRAFSIADLIPQGEDADLQVLYRTVGVGTRWLSSLEPDDCISVLGPLGRGFIAPRSDTRALLVAGGVGLPPLAWYAKTIRLTGGRALGLLGARSADLVALFQGRAVDDVNEAAAELDETHIDPLRETAWWIATDDGSRGYHGTALGALQELGSRENAILADWTVYTCGPERMMHAVAEFCECQGLKCYVCMEREMACGTGTCQSCAVAVRDSQAADGWRYRLCCTDGPVFEASQILW